MTDQPTVPLSKVLEIYEQCKQIVRSYGPEDVPQHARDALCVCMDHFKKLFERDFGGAGGR
jgi:hypothetical protein